MQVVVRGGDDPRIHRARRALADPLELPLLEDAEELDLQVQRHVADLVEEDRAAAAPARTARRGRGRRP